MIKQNISFILQQIRSFEQKYHREPNSVKLVAVTKNQSIEKIAKAMEAGQRAFGENYLQEALPKIAHFPELEWHFIGPIQSNKTKKIAEHFSWVHTVSHTQIAERLNKQRPLSLPPLNICLQINISEEASKSGLKIDEIIELATFCNNLPNLTLRGIMAIPHIDNAQKNFFDPTNDLHKLSVIYHQLQDNGFLLDTLSMGMSQDLEASIANGTTLVRVGSAIFGERTASE